jgi:hypothetical protein
VSDVDELMAGILDHLAQEDGRLMVSHRPATDGSERWVVGYEWGHEAEDSDMVGAASYGMGPVLRDALQQVFDEIGATVPDLQTDPAIEDSMRARRLHKEDGR